MAHSHTGQRNSSKRGICNSCGKKGMKNWQPTNSGWLVRSCQYCQHVEREAVTVSAKRLAKLMEKAEHSAAEKKTDDLWT